MVLKDTIRKAPQKRSQISSRNLPENTGKFMKWNRNWILWKFAKICGKFVNWNRNWVSWKFAKDPKPRSQAGKPIPRRNRADHAIFSTCFSRFFAAVYPKKSSRSIENYFDFESKIESKIAWSTQGSPMARRSTASDFDVCGMLNNRLRFLSTIEYSESAWTFPAIDKK